MHHKGENSQQSNHFASLAKWFSVVVTQILLT